MTHLSFSLIQTILSQNVFQTYYNVCVGYVPCYYPNSFFQHSLTHQLFFLPDVQAVTACKPLTSVAHMPPVGHFNMLS